MSKILDALRRMNWLTEQVLAKDDPIPLEQIEKFGKSPDVLIPDEAISMLRLPAERYSSNISNWIPDGVGGVIFAGYDQQKGDTCQIVFQGRECYGVQQGALTLLGLYKGEIVYILWNLYADRLMHGDKLIHEARHLQRALLRQNGSVLLLRWQGDTEYWTVDLDSGEATTGCKTIRKYKSLMESPSGEVYAVFEDKHVHVFENERVYKFGLFEQEAIVNIHNHTLHAVALDENQFAQAEEARHKMERWCFKSGSHPAFQKVSSIFNHPTHGLCYMGRVGNHIVTMKVPE